MSTQSGKTNYIPLPTSDARNTINAPNCFKEPLLVDPEMLKSDNVNHPAHYTKHPSGVECIEITQHYDFSVGNAMKYLWRAGLKKHPTQDDVAKEIEDLEKAKWYIDNKIALLKG